jgi:hypothetical protein
MDIADLRNELWQKYNIAFTDVNKLQNNVRIATARLTALQMEYDSLAFQTKQDKKILVAITELGESLAHLLEHIDEEPYLVFIEHENVLFLKVMRCVEKIDVTNELAKIAPMLMAEGVDEHLACAVMETLLKLSMDTLIRIKSMKRVPCCCDFEFKRHQCERCDHPYEDSSYKMISCRVMPHIDFTLPEKPTVFVKGIPNTYIHKHHGLTPDVIIKSCYDGHMGSLICFAVRGHLFLRNF